MNSRQDPEDRFGVPPEGGVACKLGASAAVWYALFRADGSTVESATSLNGASKQGIIDNKGFLQLHSDGKVSAAKSSVQLLTRADGGVQAKAGRRLRRGHKAKGRALCTCGGDAFSRCVRMKSARWLGLEQRGRS